jgi:hypothetical protein
MYAVPHSTGISLKLGLLQLEHSFRNSGSIQKLRADGVAAVTELDTKGKDHWNDQE